MKNHHSIHRARVLRAVPLRIAGVGLVAASMTSAALAQASTDPTHAHRSTSSAPVHAQGRTGSVRFDAVGSSLILTQPALSSSPGYRLVVHTNPFEVTTVRGGHRVLATTGASATDAAVRFVVGGKAYSATRVTSARWHGAQLTLQLATTDPGATVAYTIRPDIDRYRVHWQVNGEPRVVSAVGGDYSLRSAGAWYGQGIVQTDKGGPYEDQPWPLSSGDVSDTVMSPFSYFVVNPFWFTKSATGIWVDTMDVMNVQINAGGSERASLMVTNSTSSNDSDAGGPPAIGQSRRFNATVFVESTPRAVYEDYIGIAGKPQKSDTKPYQYRTPMWNDWGDLQLGVTQPSFLHYARSLHDARLPGHTVELDDGWAAGYADHAFNQPNKFPNPKAMIAKIHAMGYDFALWDTFYDNRDGDRASVLWPSLDRRGYLLKAVNNPIPFGTKTSCATTWFGGGSPSDHAGLVDLGNPAARAWLKKQVDTLAKRYGIDGWKFDTQIYDPKCQRYHGKSKKDYLRIGLNLIDQYNLTGQGAITSAWTGTQRYGFATDAIDKASTWDGLRAAAHQALSISTIGYPFTEMDMIGGSDGSNPPKSPTKAVLVRWAQAEALTPLMMGSVNPTRYDKQTVDLYRSAIQLHERLWPYLMRQVHRAVASGEPIMKPIFFNYPNDQQSYSISSEWLFGDSLLAAPVLANSSTRRIHVPTGKWYDVQNKCVVRGRTNLRNYPVTLADVPMFVKLGTPATEMLLKALVSGEQVDSGTPHC
jgi:alpha-glucosidase (family GH31 glycosyl hydrolase)